MKLISKMAFPVLSAKLLRKYFILIRYELANSRFFLFLLTFHKLLRSLKTIRKRDGDSSITHIIIIRLNTSRRFL
jgi:hypothetical protein